MHKDILTFTLAAAAAVALAGCAQTRGFGGSAEDARYGTTTTTGSTYEGYDRYGGSEGYRGETTGYCPNCGTVEEITVLEESNQGVGLGAVLGTIAGGVAGSQVGGGTGKTAATIAGAAGGGYAGHQLQKRYGDRVDFRVSVDMDDGGERTLVQDDDPGVRIGQRVRIVDGTVRPL